MNKGPFQGKIRRFATSTLLPVDRSRSGQCDRCGACCKFLFRCPFLKEIDGDPPTFVCRAYALRPPQCRKYPRCEAEQIHQPCGYRFVRQGEGRT
ncbi:MAG: hypothetical protein A3K67_01510 [Euryarchaeota archaeon RBG_16_62_10]|nr:MAG: hypothetical protein A3K67_01510 [Euryarchaeota archaeon RBG_16_62_10]